MKHLYLLILLTFVTGFIGGAVLFIQTGREDSELESQPVSEQSTERGYEVVGYRYGGCERLGCPSYRIQDDGTYTYIARDQNGQDRRYADTISGKRRKELEAAVRSTDFERVQANPYTATCPAEYDGIAYRYEIERDDVRYSIDSCREVIDGENLFILLADYFEIFSVTHRNE